MARNIKSDGKAPSMAEILLDPRNRKAQNQFLNQVDMMIDWRPIRTLTNKKYTKKQADEAGAPAYDVIVLFKMMLLQTWYGLSDCALEERINDSLSFSRFLGLAVEAVSPDHSTLSRFRTALTKLGLMDKLLDALNKQLKKYHVSIKQGALVDASVVETPFTPKGPLTIEVAEDREDTRSEEEKGAEEEYQKSVTSQGKGTDAEARWVKKKGYKYGYKKHVLTDTDGIVRSVITTPANRSDIKELPPLIAKAGLPKGTPVLADKGYASKENRDCLRQHGLIDGIMHKAARNHPLTEADKTFNKLISPIRSTIERTFGSIKRWFHGGRCRYRGLAKAHTQNVLEGMAFNLYRTPGLIMSRGLI